MKAVVAPGDVDHLLDRIDRHDPAGKRFIYVGGLPDDGVVLEIPFDPDAIFLKFLYPDTRLSN